MTLVSYPQCAFIQTVKSSETQGCLTAKESFVEECVVSLHTFSCLHMAPDKCRMQSAEPGARIALPSPFRLPPPSCLNLSLPVSPHFQLTNCPVALTLVIIHSFPIVVLWGIGVNGSEQPWTNTQCPWGGGGGEGGRCPAAACVWTLSDLPAGFTVFSHCQFINLLYNLPSRKWRWCEMKTLIRFLRVAALWAAEITDCTWCGLRV